MSASVPAAGVGAAAITRPAERARPASAAGRERPGVRAVAFAALALYGVLQWMKLMTEPPAGRLLALLAVAVIVPALAPVLRRGGRGLLVIAAVAAVLVAFPLSGVPLGWVAHVRVAVTAQAIGQGLSQLPGAYLPYSGAGAWVRMVIAMGAAVLLLDAALLLAFARPGLGDARRAAVVLPLLALAVVPDTLLRPRHPYLQGLLLFALIVAFMWGERVRRPEIAWALGAGAVAAVAGLLLGPALEQQRPWINYEALAAALTPANLERFDWSQRYGPLDWPQTGRAVLEVQAAHADYWKTEDLDGFDGRAWTAAPGAGPDALAGVSAASQRRWTQTLHVTLDAMSSSAVIAAGTAEYPTQLTGVLPGASPGTWRASSPLGPGDSYLVTTYSPHPAPAELAAAGERYPDRSFAALRSLDLAPRRFASAPIPVVFPPFHSGRAIVSAAGEGAAVVAASAYAPAYALARRLAARTSTPYGFVMSVERYLARGYSYDESPPVRAYPLESFLFEDKIGYCQQFAGAMALLLRMGGIPARVATGFTTGLRSSARRAWVATDLDAHAWVEAWFPHYGWVRFDPTPAVAPARGGSSQVAAPPSLAAAAALAQSLRVGHEGQVSAASGGTVNRVGRSSGVSPVALVAGILALLAAAGFAAALLIRRRRRPAVEALLLELERALARSGRPLGAATTLAALEQRLRSSSEAAAYVRALRLARFGGGTAPPTPEQRRALRAHLRAGLGFGGALRALWALPPGWPPARDPRARLRPRIDS
ncbi:MAG: transglutaminase domain-containing protein [Solirubrobacterales bacterium]|nr:transglutaminase domain-containing protein [Solirubrobacterales bacterium]